MHLALELILLDWGLVQFFHFLCFWVFLTPSVMFDSLKVCLESLKTFFAYVKVEFLVFFLSSWYSVRIEVVHFYLMPSELSIPFKSLKTFRALPRLLFFFWEFLKNHQNSHQNPIKKKELNYLHFKFHYLSQTCFNFWLDSIIKKLTQIRINKYKFLW